MDFSKLDLSFLNETEITRWKRFYKTHLLKFPNDNRRKALSSIAKLRERFDNILSGTFTIINSEITILKVDAEFMLKDYFSDKVIDMFNRTIEIGELTLQKEGNDTFLVDLLKTFYQSFEHSAKKYRAELTYKDNFLRFLYHCLQDYGLHSGILKRPEASKRFNLVVTHTHALNTTQCQDRRLFMTKEEFENDFVAMYSQRKPIKMKGKFIPFESIYEVSITTTLFKDDEIELFALKNNFEWNLQNKDYETFISLCCDETEKYHPNPFDGKVHLEAQIDNISAFSLFLKLIPFEKSYKLFHEAMQKIVAKQWKRNIVDDLRLCLELFLKEKLQNNKPLEKQIQDVGQYLNNRGEASEITNMFHKLLDYYTKYQNDHAKHNDDVKGTEVNLIFNLTSSFIEHIIG